jgi:hypothetical protein
MGTSPKAEYERLREISEEARAKSEQARITLAQHSAVNGC